MGRYRHINCKSIKNAPIIDWELLQLVKGYVYPSTPAELFNFEN